MQKSTARRCGLALVGALLLVLGTAATSTAQGAFYREVEKDGRPRFHVVVPGPVATPMRGQSHPGEARTSLATPETIARAYLKVLSPGGRTLGPGPLEVETNSTDAAGTNRIN